MFRCNWQRHPRKSPAGGDFTWRSISRRRHWLVFLCRMCSSLGPTRCANEAAAVHHAVRRGDCVAAHGAAINAICSWLPSTRPWLIIKMPDPKDDPKSSEWRPYIFARDQWHCRICGDRFLYSEMVRKHIANQHNETMPPSMYEYFRGAVWQRKRLP